MWQSDAQTRGVLEESDVQSNLGTEKAGINDRLLRPALGVDNDETSSHDFDASRHEEGKPTSRDNLEIDHDYETVETRRVEEKAFADALRHDEALPSTTNSIPSALGKTSSWIRCTDRPEALKHTRL